MLQCVMYPSTALGMQAKGLSITYKRHWGKSISKMYSFVNCITFSRCVNCLAEEMGKSSSRLPNVYVVLDDVHVIQLHSLIISSCLLVVLVFGNGIDWKIWAQGGSSRCFGDVVAKFVIQFLWSWTSHSTSLCLGIEIWKTNYYYMST